MKKSKLNIVFSAVFLLTLINVSDQYHDRTDSNNLIGCCNVSTAGQEFSTYASHLMPNMVTPKNCAQACYAMNYALAGIRDGNMCFCKKTNTINATTFINMEICMNPLPITCSGDANLYCGQKNIILIYTATPQTSSFLNVISI